ncbi:MAG: hypothetical protein ACLTX6_03870 [Lachnospiraceae bacterium]
MKAAEDGIIRPVLCLERKEINEYLRERNLPYVTDSSKSSGRIYQKQDPAPCTSCSGKVKSMKRQWLIWQRHLS